MLQQIHTNSNSHSLDHDTEEMDLLNLIRQVLRTWKLWLLSLLLVSVVYGAIKAVQILVLIPESTYSKPIRLTFPGAHKMTFPSGAKFSYSDIVAPSVIKEVYEKNAIDRFGFTVADLQRGLSATPYAPTYPLIIERYNKLMGDKKLTPTQIADLQKALEKEIEQATNGEVLVIMRLHKKELPENVIAEVLADIPMIWAERTLKEKGVLDVNVQLTSAKSLNIDLITQKDPLIASDMLIEKISLLRENIKQLATYEGIQSIIDPKTGMRLADLSLATDDLNNYKLNELIAPIRVLGISRNPDDVRYYYYDKLSRLDITLSILKRQVIAIKDVYNSYSGKEIGFTNNIDKNGSQLLMPELSIDMLDKLVGMSGNAEREKYKQQLNNELLTITNKISVTESSVSDTKYVLANLEKFMAQDNKKYEHYLVSMDQELPNILDQLTKFFAISERIYKQLSIESVGFKDQLYVPVTNNILTKKIILDVKSTLFTWIALLFLTTIVVIPGCVIRNALKARTQAALVAT